MEKCNTLKAMHVDRTIHSFKLKWASSCSIVEIIQKRNLAVQSGNAIQNKKSVQRNLNALVTTYASTVLYHFAVAIDELKA